MAFSIGYLIVRMDLTNSTIASKLTSRCPQLLIWLRGPNSSLGTLYETILDFVDTGFIKCNFNSRAIYHGKPCDENNHIGPLTHLNPIFGFQSHVEILIITHGLK
ncbi:hypothetical protein TorRG33x02_016080 [Trema orientale]|uniref:Uncharacterized protein n=1 Tax=Trema orientale TaxID=63057 RepID=A0A2P5FXV2_TREOI|nr:hypothetical protein TorRG33x02_016080 [Trema orientale]